MQMPACKCQDTNVLCVVCVAIIVLTARTPRRRNASSDCPHSATLRVEVRANIDDSLSKSAEDIADTLIHVRMSLVCVHSNVRDSADMLIHLCMSIASVCVCE